MTEALRERLLKILTEPTKCLRDDCQVKHRIIPDQAIDQIDAAFRDEGWTKVNIEHKGKLIPLYTGQEFYDRFVAEYHMRADWIAGDPEMGEDAEHDVLLAAKLAAGLDK